MRTHFKQDEDGLKQKALRKEDWAYVLAHFLQEDPDMCRMLQHNLERAGIKVALDEREPTEQLASVVDYVLQEAQIEIESDLSDYTEHEQGEIIYRRLTSAI